MGSWDADDTLREDGAAAGRVVLDAAHMRVDRPHEDPVRRLLDLAMWALVSVTDEASKLGVVRSVAQSLEALRPGNHADASGELSDAAIYHHGLDADAVQSSMAAGIRRTLTIRAQRLAPIPAAIAAFRQHLPQSVIDAADYVRRQGDADTLRHWLEAHRAYLPCILEHWRQHG